MAVKIRVKNSGNRKKSARLKIKIGKWRKSPEQWKDSEWDVMHDKLEKLSIKELRDLTTRVGIQFTIGNENIDDREEFLNVLYEADKEKLKEEYRKLISK